MMKSLTTSGRLICIALVAALAGLIVYIITSTTGYLAGSKIDALPIIFTAVGILLGCVLVAASHKMNPLLSDLIIVASTVLIIVSFALFVLVRVRLAADIYFIPVNYPKAEEVALNISIAGFVCYLFSIISMIIASFSARFSSK